MLNTLLTVAWDKHAAALETGATVQLEDDATAWMDSVLAKRLRPIIDAELGEFVDGESVDAA